ncbi:hypothetical protein [Streptomyces radicis]|uniref:Uncharacterized protein n=1 Tax=Streptomyces radicis TaxID=1750517 RepID=A0A3A9WGC9_9ACTN|nr:hypothetical protein [Streptomyces radicis]RKN12015.1 hypothetical protein D7319_03695 [Streptomyces radicis]RKN25934.1 hypothetical protein D7318_06785 [Streptomyces radicis]
MSGIQEIIGRIRQELDGELRERVRKELAGRPRAWLVDQLLGETLGPAASPSAPALRAPAGTVGDPGLDVAALAELVERYRALTREGMEAEGLLIGPPAKGGELIGPERRSAAGAELLHEAKDMLHALLFGTPEDGVYLNRVGRELLTITVPRAKAHSIAFALRAATEIGAEGTWRAPAGPPLDDRAPNTLLQVEYGEVTEELVGNGIVACLKVINNLEINEQVLYARMESVDEVPCGRRGDGG